MPGHPADERAGRTDLVFAVLPFADIERPAIGVSLLQAEVEALGVRAAIEYLNFDLAETIGPALYTRISEGIPSETLVGEWFFADVVFGDRLPHEQLYLSKILAAHASGSLVDEIVRARAARHAFVEAAAQTLLARRPRIVGFTTTFHQTCCCLAVARRLKEAPDPPIILFGGANCEGEMGLQMLRSFPWIDHVCTREGDVAVPRLVRRLLDGDGGDGAPIPGIIGRADAAALSLPELVVHLDELPIPDYRDYMARLARARVPEPIRPELLIETSRGCWWGAKHHCTFCGLNGDTMAFRSKSPARAFAELAFLRRTYGVRKIDCVDNILDMRYLDTLFRDLAAAELDVELFYEVKANLRREHVALLRAGGVRSIQPGIESFSNDVLRRMDKGCTGLQNLQLLRWCDEVGITVAWNLLAGFPGEDPAEYARMAELVPLLTHLQPPTSCSPIRLDRFSPLFNRAAEHGLLRVRPTAAYFHVYPLARRELMRLASFFDFDYADGRAPASYVAPLRRAIDEWHVARAAQPELRPRLEARPGDGGAVLVDDTRACAVRPAHRLQGLLARALVSCDVAQTAAALAARLTAGDRRAIDAALAELAAARLVVEMEGRHLALPVMRNREALGANDADHQLPQAATRHQLLPVV